MRHAGADLVSLTRRNLLKVKRVPDLMAYTMLTPIMFVVLLSFVFGSAVVVPGMSYREYLMAGIFTYTVVLSATSTGGGIVEDLHNGFVNRLRSLPVAPATFLYARTSSDALKNVISLVVMSATGLLVGWRIHAPWASALAGFGLLLLFAYAMSWLMVLVGLFARGLEVYNNASFIALFPLCFLANTFVPTTNMTVVVKFLAEWNPVSAVTQATRELFGNTALAFPAPDALPMRHAIATSLCWSAVILGVCVPAAVMRYRRIQT